jgi:hypothetical protein
MAKTKSSSVIKRVIKLYGVDLPIIVSLSEEGVAMAVSGTKTKVSGTWESVARSLQTPDNVPSYLMGKPKEFLARQAKKQLQKGEKDAA